MRLTFKTSDPGSTPTPPKPTPRPTPPKPTPILLSFDERATAREVLLAMALHSAASPTPWLFQIKGRLYSSGRLSFLEQKELLRSRISEACELSETAYSDRSGPYKRRVRPPKWLIDTILRIEVPDSVPPAPPDLS